MEFSYRPHIDGLRALAVMAVFLFHLYPSIFPGGYLGVDIFFVISGFVITQSLYGDYLKNKKIRLGNFYKKRFKRLYPALMVMVLLTTITYLFFGFQWDTNLYLKTAITSLLGVSNLYLLFHGDTYFDQDLLNPLVHTWSLGIEEQFYLVYPVFLIALLWAAQRFLFKEKKIAAILLGLAVLLFGIFVFAGDTIFGNYYFPTARFWELLAGATLFFVSLSWNRLWKPSMLMVGALGVFFVIFFAQTYIDSLQIETLGAVLITSILIFGGLHSDNSIKRVLSMQQVVYVGKISYSFYLWHLPVIYFASLYFGGVWFFLTSVVCSFALAAGSYHLLEKPLRHGKVLDRGIVWGLWLAPVVFVGLIAVVLFHGQAGVRNIINESFNTWSREAKTVNYIEQNFGLAERIVPAYLIGSYPTDACTMFNPDAELNEYGLRVKCLKQTSTTTLFYLTGDSHAAQFLPMLNDSLMVENLYFARMERTYLIPEDAASFDEGEAERIMTERKEEIERASSVYENVVYISSNFLSERQDAMELMEQNLRRHIEAITPYAPFIFVAPTPLYPASPESCVLLKKHCEISADEEQERRKKVVELQQKLADEYEGVYLYDPHSEICTQGVCRIYDHERDFLSGRDDDHISVEQGRALTPHFENWFRATVVEHEEVQP